LSTIFLRGKQTPSDIPVEQTEQVELVVNLRAARKTRHALPASFVLRRGQIKRMNVAFWHTSGTLPGDL